MEYEVIPLDSENDLFKSIPGSVYRCLKDKYSTIVNANQEFFDLVGFTRVEISRRFKNGLINMIHPFEREDVVIKREQQLAVHPQCTCNYRILCKDGSYRWVLDSCRIVRDAAGNETVLGIMLDTTEIENTIEELESTLDRHRTIMNQTSDILFEWDVKTDVIFCSSHWQEKFGYELQCHKPADSNHSENLHPDDLRKAEKLLQEAQAGNPYLTTELRIRDKSGSYLWCRIRVSNQFDEKGKLAKVIGIIQDIDEEKRMIENLRRRAERDALTGLYNRAETQKQIKNYLEKKKDEYSALFMIDTDNFKLVNDNGGHLFGDAVLSEIAAGMKKIVRKSDIIGRIGGDEFTIFVKNISSMEAAEIKARQLLDIFHHLFETDKRGFAITCSIGIALYPRDGIDFQSLYSCADQALYEAKSRGKDCYVMYEKRGRRLSNLNLTSLGAAIDSDMRAPETVPEDLVNYVFQILYDTDDTDEAIRLLLEIIGKRFDVSRVYIFENSEDGIYCDNTYEWCNEGIKPEKEMLQHMSYEELDSYMDFFKENPVFYCRDIYQLSSAAQIALFEQQNICSTLQCAMMDKTRFVGFIGFDECTGTRLWTKEEVGTLSRISQMLSTFLQKKRAQEKDHRTVNQLRNILDKQDAYIYVIDEKTFEIFYLNLKTKLLDDTAAEGMFCYEAFFGRRSPCTNCPLLHENIKEIYNPKYDVWTRVHVESLKWEKKDAYLISCYDITEYMRGRAVRKSND